MSATTRIITRNEKTFRVMRTCLLEARRRSWRRTFRLEAPVGRVGSHPSNDLVLDDQTVSKHHLEIEVTDRGFRVQDLSSANGTFAGPLRIHHVVVSGQVTLRLGETVLSITPDAREVEVPAATTDGFGPLVGASAKMRELFAQLERLSPTDATVLLEGETGVGKDLVARAIHDASPRAGKPFVVVDCAALSAGLLESELFGHIRGAFTGADADRIGLAEAAHGGTLFLDEVVDLPMPLQARLLGVLERKAVIPVGATRPRPVDVRVIAATHENLARAVNEERFRSDLFYRIAVIRLRVPPLRERLEDIPLLVERFLDELRARWGERVPPGLTAVTFGRLAGQRWPGNVRELRNAIERAVLRLEDLGDGASEVTHGSGGFAEARTRAVAAFERAYLSDALREAAYNVSQAARSAGLDRRNFQRLLRRHGIDVGHLKATAR